MVIMVVFGFADFVAFDRVDFAFGFDGVADDTFDFFAEDARGARFFVTVFVSDIGSSYDNELISACARRKLK